MVLLVCLKSTIFISLTIENFQFVFNMQLILCTTQQVKAQWLYQEKKYTFWIRKDGNPCEAKHQLLSRSWWEQMKDLVSGLQQLSNQLPLVTPNNSHRQEITRQTSCSNSGSRAKWSAEMTHTPSAVTSFLCKKKKRKWNYLLKIQDLAAICWGALINVKHV